MRCDMKYATILSVLVAGSTWERAHGFTTNLPASPSVRRLPFKLQPPVKDLFQTSRSKTIRYTSEIKPEIQITESFPSIQKNEEPSIIEPFPDEPSHAESLPVVEKFLKGLKRDAKAKAPYYISDIKDGFNLKTLSAVVFLFFGCIAPAVAFGGVLSKVTNNAIGTMEMLLSTSVCGMIYALLSGQPLTIIGSTGPVLAFTGVLYRTCAALGQPFLPVYAWTGLWSAGYLGLAAVFSLSNIVEGFTRFTDEVFSLLISAIFVAEAVQGVLRALTDPLVPLAQGLATLVLATTTYQTAVKLKGIKETPYLGRRRRQVLADFAPSLGIAAGVLGATLLKARNAGAALVPTLPVPAVFATTSGRPWAVDLLSLPPAARWACALPAAMAAVLLFMDQTITVHLVNATPTLEKGYGLHLDMAVLAALTAGCSVFGLPWLVAATVRSVAHVNGLTTTDEGTGRPVKVAEQRVSGFAIHALILAAILVGRAQLAQIPLAVLSGLFLYLGTSSLRGNQLYERLKLVTVVDPRKKPPTAQFCADLPRRTVRKYTSLQMACLAALWLLKGSPVGVLFPVMIALLPPIRHAIERAGSFTKEELAVLDA